MILQEVKWSPSVWAKSSAKRGFTNLTPINFSKTLRSSCLESYLALTPTLQKEMI